MYKVASSSSLMFINIACNTMLTPQAGELQQPPLQQTPGDDEWSLKSSVVSCMIC
jgi:hypothetical protein